ncbi:hypothetical protein ACFWCU_13360 [Bacillus subtilis]
MCDSGALGLKDWFHITETFGIMTFIAGSLISETSWCCIFFGR